LTIYQNVSVEERGRRRSDVRRMSVLNVHIWPKVVRCRRQPCREPNLPIGGESSSRTARIIGWTTHCIPTISAPLYTIAVGGRRTCDRTYHPKHDIRSAYNWVSSEVAQPPPFRQRAYRQQWASSTAAAPTPPPTSTPATPRATAPTPPPAQPAPPTPAPRNPETTSCALPLAPALTAPHITTIPPRAGSSIPADRLVLREESSASGAAAAAGQVIIRGVHDKDMSRICITS